MRSLRFNDKVIEYELVRKNVKNINVRIRSNGQVFVSASPHIPVKVIEEFLLSKGDIIVKTIESFSKLPPEKPPQDGDSVQILNKSYYLSIQTGAENSIRLTGQILYMTVKCDDSDVKHRLLNMARKKLMREPLIELCDRVYSVFEPLGVAYPEIRIKNMKSRWGSCNTSKNIITFSTLLCEMPMPFVEYVVVHEFAHLVHPNHSKAFYSFIESLLPDYKERKALAQKRR
jgi:predicted metal-dependent hydrolase